MLKVTLSALLMLVSAGLYAEPTVFTTDTPPGTTPPTTVVTQPVTTVTPASTTTTITVQTTPTTMSDSDQKIVAAIYDKYGQSAALIGTNLSVASLNGSVTISGKVTQQAQLDEAIAQAKKIIGVKSVTSTVIVTTVPQLEPVSQPTNY